jgi:hypothetical protein
MMRTPNRGKRHLQAWAMSDKRAYSGSSTPDGMLHQESDAIVAIVRNLDHSQEGCITKSPEGLFWPSSGCAAISRNSEGFMRPSAVSQLIMYMYFVPDAGIQ